MRCLVIMILLTGCYNQRKAAVQHWRAVTTFPAIGAEYCAITYPVRETVIHGKDSIRTDTLWSTEYTTDTVVRENVKYITKYLPGSTIRETVIRTDTVIKENTAALAKARIDAGNALVLATDKTVEAADFKAKRNKWRLIAIGCMAIIGLGIFLKLRKRFA